MNIFWILLLLYISSSLYCYLKGPLSGPSCACWIPKSTLKPNFKLIDQQKRLFRKLLYNWDNIIYFLQSDGFTFYFLETALDVKFSVGTRIWFKAVLSSHFTLPFTPILREFMQ